jgi:sialate O-acetylesterase
VDWTTYSEGGTASLSHPDRENYPTIIEWSFTPMEKATSQLNSSPVPCSPESTRGFEMGYYVVSVLLALLIFGESFASNSFRAKVELPEIFSDHMVLQREQPIAIWGKAGPFETIEIRLNGSVVKPKADFTGKWEALLKPMPAGGPYDLVVQGINTITIHDVLLGDVWLCSGQSNMLWTVGDCEFMPADVRLANFSQLRHFVRKKPERASKDLPTVWREADSENVPNFSAVAYFFSRELQSKTKIPIGVIECPVGGSPIKTWISQSSIGKRGKIPNWPGWFYSSFFEGLIIPLCQYHLKGAIWYQGESDATLASEYPRLLGMLIKDWRSAFREPNMPFFIVQLPNVAQRYDHPSESFWAELREAQQKCTRLHNVYMTVNIDTAYNGPSGADLHPPTKAEVGHRLAQLVLHETYGFPGHWRSPTFDRMSVQGNKVAVHFHEADGGIYACGKETTGFTIAGEDKLFHLASAQLEPDHETVTVSCDDVSHPVAVRYAWADNPECNLYNCEGLPVAPFRTDNWISDLDKSLLHPHRH